MAAAPAHRPLAADAAVAAALTLAGQAEAWTAALDGGSRAITVASALVATTAVAFARSRPLAAALAVVVALLAKEALGGAPELVLMLVPGVLTAFAVGARLPARRSAGGLAALLVVSSLATLVGDQSVPTELLFTTLVVGSPWAAGRLVRDRSERAAMLEELAERRAREASTKVRLAAAEERARIARELHDLVGHSVSVMVLQAGAAEAVVRDRPAQAAAALQSIQETGRTAIDELRRVLGLLREDDAGAETSAPLPGVRELGALADQVRDAGLDVELEVHGDPQALSDGVSLAAYRIVQEALTNVRKHAGTGRAHVVVRYGGDALRVEVVDRGRGAGEANPAGHGLLGMRERVALYGGRLDAGPAPGGGFRVAAELPLEEPA